MSTPTQDYQSPQAAPSIDDFLFGGPSRRGRSMRFPMVGTSNTGVICDTPRMEQQRDPERNNELKFWEPRQGQTQGDPMWQLVVPVQIDLTANPHLRNPEIETDGTVDDGVRYFYLSGSKDPASKSSLSAVADAVRRAGAKGLAIGGRLTVTYTQDMPKRAGSSVVAKNPKGYEANYDLPANVALMGGAPAEQNTNVTGPPQNVTTNGYAAPTAPVAQAPAQPAPQVQQAPAAPAAPVNGVGAPDAADERETAIRAMYAHLPAGQIEGLVASGLPLDRLMAMPGLAPA